MIELDYIPKVQKYDKNINIESYLNALDKLFEVEGKKESTNRLYKLFLNQFFQYCFDNQINPIEPGLDNIYNFFDYKDWAPGTKLIVKHALSKFYNQMLNRGYVINLKIKNIEKTPYVLNPEKLKQFFESINDEYDRLVLEFKYSCGIRTIELINLRWGDLNYETYTGMVYDTKNGTDRVIYLLYRPKEILEKLLKYKRGAKDSDFIFKYHDRRQIWKMVIKYAKKFGDYQIRPHTLRHCFATHLAEKDFNSFKIKQLGGWKNLKTAESYINLAESRKLIELPKKAPLD